MVNYVEKRNQFFVDAGRVSDVIDYKKKMSPKRKDETLTA